MILDNLNNARRYFCLHPRFEKAFEFLTSQPLHSLAVGTHEIDGDRIYANVQQREAIAQEAAKLEAHRRYIDIQVCITGTESHGWRCLADCSQVTEPYDDSKDIIFYAETPTSYATATSGQFVIFFPQDAHAPFIGQGVLKKIILKVLID
ncbi:beta-D-galactosidase [Bacteroidia bacterium]|nr:beta-D-galactosidase [Bacteroidia bacterium]